MPGSLGPFYGNPDRDTHLFRMAEWMPSGKGGPFYLTHTPTGVGFRAELRPDHSGWGPGSPTDLVAYVDEGRTLALRLEPRQLDELGRAAVLAFHMLWEFWLHDSQNEADRLPGWH